MAARYRAQADAEMAHSEVVETSLRPDEPPVVQDHIPASPSGSSTSAGRALDAGPQEIDLSDEWERVSAQHVPEAASIGPEQAGEIVEEIRFYLTESLLREAEFAIQHLSEVDPSNPELPALRQQLAANAMPAKLRRQPRRCPVEEIEIELPAFAAQSAGEHGRQFDSSHSVPRRFRPTSASSSASWRLL